MTPTKKMIKAAMDGLYDEFRKEAVVPVQGGQIPPPQGNVSPPLPPGGDPAMAGLPPGPPGAPPGMPPGMDPSMMGGPPPGGAPMDPAAGGMPMDPSMMGPPPGGDPMAPPPDEGAPEEDAASAQNTETAQQSGDVLVPVKAMTEMVTRVIEATKGKRTADPKDPNAAGAPGAGGAPAGPLPGMDPAVSNIGGAPSDGGMAMPGMAPPGGPPKMGAERIAALENIIARIDAHKRG